VTSPSGRLPAVFIGHGTPTNALDANVYTVAWRALGSSLPRPRAIVAISAHWYTRGTFVTANATPPTIHDFAGFPRPLYEMRYDAPGAPELSARVATQLAPVAVRESLDWGLDHGTWSVLVHMYPMADVPVVQLSIDAAQPPAFHYRVGQQLASLRDDGILILGSGGVVHNLGRVVWDHAAPPPQWAQSFDDCVRTRVAAGDHQALIAYEGLGDAARLSVPTPEHYLPLLYVLGTARPGEAATIPVTGFDLGTISMTSVVIGDG
jgi:4,5-DOPA dioxygenase extradiol